MYTYIFYICYNFEKEIFLPSAKTAKSFLCRSITETILLIRR